MKAAFVKGPSQVEIRTVEKPVVESGDILVKMQACGVCGSDLEKIYGQYSQPSMRLGHEPSGIIIEVGKSVTNFKKGDRVFVHHHVPCHSCHYCFHGNETMCKKYSETNLLPCGLAEEFVVPEWNVSHEGVIKIPDSMTFEEAAMIEPLACCVRSYNKILSKTQNRGVDVAIVATGNLDAVTQAIEFVRKGGTVVLFGVPTKDAKLLVDMSKVYSKEITITPSYAASDSDTLNALKLIQEGKTNVKSIITHKFDLEDSHNALQYAHQGNDSMKIII